MRKIFFIISFIFVGINVYGQQDTTKVYSIDEISVVSFFNNDNHSTEYDKVDVIETNYGQEPSNIFAKMPSIISLNDNGTEFGYGYFRIRGLDQTRINVMLDGCPWNEAEDFGSYFANSPDLISSMDKISIQRGTNSNNNGIAGSAGAINFESINIWDDNVSYAHIGGGSFDSYKASIIYNMSPTNGWGLHIKGTVQGTDGYRDYGFNHSKALTIKTGYKYNTNHSIDILSKNGFHRNGQGWIGNTIEELENNPNANGCTSLEDDNWFMSMNKLQYKGRLHDNIILTSSVYYQYQTGSYRFDLDNYMKRMVDDTWGITNMLYDYGLTHNMVGGNIIGKFYLSDVTLNVGVNGYTYNRKHFSGNKSKNIPVEENYNNNGFKNDFNGFLTINYSLLNNLSFGGNIQFRHTNFNYKDHINPEYNFTSNKYNTNWNFINWDLNVNYNPNNNILLYAKYSCVNREPTRSDMFGGNESFGGEIITITPEIANDVELGISGNHKKVNYNINLYYMWFNNELILNGELGLNGLPCHENAENSYRTGIEGSVNWNIFDNLYFDFNGSYSFNKVKSESFGKKNHILTPNATMDCDLKWVDDIWNIGINTNYHSSMFIDMNNDYSIPDLFSLNLYGGAKINNIEVGMRLNNITNRTNYCTGMLGSNNNILYIKNVGFNINCSLKIYF